MEPAPVPLTVLVTGAAHGIGRATAALLVARGARVVACDIDEPGLTALAANAPDSIRTLAVDLRDVSGFADLIERARAAFGSLNGLINVAGVIVRRNDLDTVTEADWDLQHDVNLKAPFFLARAFRAGAVRAGETGSIVLFSSQSWSTGGFGGTVAYAASKGGVVSLTRGLARTFAPDGIRVNCVAPGFIETGMMDGISADSLSSLIEQVPLGRLGEPDEVASGAVFLVSPEASYITGATLNISGGQLMY